MVVNFLNGEQVRTYKKNECITFRKTNEEFGGLSNMAPGYAITIGQIHLLTSEALYQACRFPDHPEIQKKIIEQHSPMTAKEISKQYIELSRNDWNEERVRIMRWCLQVKLICNWRSFGELLNATENKSIIEDSPKDDFWGAMLNNEIYTGVNALGRLLMQLRELYRNMSGKHLISLSPLKIPNFMLLGNPITYLYIDVSKQPYSPNLKMW